MATDLITRTGAGAALTAGQHDQNIESISGTVEAKVADYTVLYTDQNKTIEFNKATAVTCNISAIATIAAAIDTTSFRVTIKNIGAGICTIDPNGAETIDGAATLALNQYEATEIQIDGAGTGWSIIKNKGVTETGTETLTNKTITAPQIATITPDGIETITLPVATDTLVGKATTDTFTNKTFSTGTVIGASMTWSAAQNLNNQALTNVNIDSGNLAGVTVSASLTWSAAQNFSTGTTTIATADINGGNIDGTTIGGSTPAAGTFSSLALTTDLAVTHGGTGASSLQDHWVLVGSGTGAITPVSPSTAGLVLTSNGTSTDPSFQATVAPSDFANTSVAISAVNTTGTASWDPGFSTSNFQWGITSVKRTDGADLGASAVVRIRARDGNGAEQIFTNDNIGGTGTPVTPTRPSATANTISLTGAVPSGAGTVSYTVYLWARKNI